MSLASAPEEPTYKLGDTLVNRYDLYELAVQCPPIEAAFLEAVHGDAPKALGEDFSGPAGVGRAWIARNDNYTAIAADRDEAPLRHAVRRLTEQHGNHAIERLTVRPHDVLEVGDRADIIAALNFALYEIHTRPRLVTYLRHTLMRLNAGGVLVCDTYGGADQWISGTHSQTIETDLGAIEYAWEQRTADPTTARITNAIHFTLPSGVDLQDAFLYDWRHWAAADIREAMREAGFRTTEVYDRYGDAMDQDGNLLVRPISTDANDQQDDPVELDDTFVLYVVGRV